MMDVIWKDDAIKAVINVCSILAQYHVFNDKLANFPSYPYANHFVKLMERKFASYVITMLGKKNIITEATIYKVASDIIDVPLRDTIIKVKQRKDYINSFYVDLLRRKTGCPEFTAFCAIYWTHAIKVCRDMNPKWYPQEIFLDAELITNDQIVGLDEFRDIFDIKGMGTIYLRLLVLIASSIGRERDVPFVCVSSFEDMDIFLKKSHIKIMLTIAGLPH